MTIKHVRDKALAGRASTYLLPAVRCAMKEAGVPHVAALSRAFNDARRLPATLAPDDAVSYKSMLALVNGEAPFDSALGGYTTLAEDVADFLKKSPHELFGIAADSMRDHAVDPEQLPQDERTQGFSAPEEDVWQYERVAALDKCLAQLDERYAEVIRLRYGLNGEVALTSAEIAQRWNISEPRVKQLEARAEARLKWLVQKDYGHWSKGGYWGRQFTLHI